MEAGMWYHNLTTAGQIKHLMKEADLGMFSMFNQTGAPTRGSLS